MFQQNKNKLKESIDKVWWVLCVYFVIWTVSPIFFTASFPLDVPEGIYWGSEWQLGYYKHPPFSSWVLYSFYAVLGEIGPYFLSQLCIFLTLICIYFFAQNFVSKEKALYAGILTLGIYYYTWPSLEFNHNVAQMPIWVGIIYLTYLAIHQNQWKYWLGLGGLMGIGMLTKYPVAILIFAIVLCSLHSAYRHLWQSAKPWVAIVVALLIFMPHVYWLYQSDWLPFTYIESRSVAESASANRLGALGYVLAQIMSFLPLIVILLCNRIFSFSLQSFNRQDQVFIFFLGIFPGLFLFVIGFGFGVKIHDMWASPMWSLIAFICVAMIPEDIFQQHKKGIMKGLLIWLGLVTVCMMIYLQFGGVIRNKSSRMDWPQAQISTNVQQQWKALATCKMDNIGGDDWLAILAATKMPTLPSVMISESAAYSPWMNLQRLNENGSFFLWEQGKKPMIPYLTELENNQQLVQQRGQWLIKWEKVPNKAPLIVEWQAFIPQSCLQPSFKGVGQ